MSIRTSSTMTRFLIAAGMIVSAAQIISAETMLNLKMGPAWPKELRNEPKEEKIVAWEPSIEYGVLFDRRVAIGLDLEFQWCKRQDDSPVVDTTYVNGQPQLQNRTVVDRIERYYQFPPSFFLSIDPAPHLIVHPVVKGQIGMTLLYYSNKWFEDSDGDGSKDDEKKSNDSGLYYGVFGKVGADALYDLGENVSVFAGFEFQFGNARHKVDGTANEYYTKEIHGPGIRMGFRFLM